MEQIIQAFTAALPVAWTVGIQQQLLSDERRQQFWIYLTIGIIAYGLGYTASRRRHA